LLWSEGFIWQKPEGTWASTKTLQESAIWAGHIAASLRFLPLRCTDTRGCRTDGRRACRPRRLPCGRRGR
jgi:hypothetical protein